MAATIRLPARARGRRATARSARRATSRSAHDLVPRDQPVAALLPAGGDGTGDRMARPGPQHVDAANRLRESSEIAKRRNVGPRRITHPVARRDRVEELDLPSAASARPSFASITEARNASTAAYTRSTPASRLAAPRSRASSRRRRRRAAVGEARPRGGPPPPAHRVRRPASGRTPPRAGAP